MMLKEDSCVCNVIERSSVRIFALDTKNSNFRTPFFIFLTGPLINEKIVNVAFFE